MMMHGSTNIKSINLVYTNTSAREINSFVYSEKVVSSSYLQYMMTHGCGKELSSHWQHTYEISHGTQK